MGAMVAARSGELPLLRLFAESPAVVIHLPLLASLLRLLLLMSLLHPLLLPLLLGEQPAVGLLLWWLLSQLHPLLMSPLHLVLLLLLLSLLLLFWTLRQHVVATHPLFALRPAYQKQQVLREQV